MSKGDDRPPINAKNTPPTETSARPWQSVPINDCGEPLEVIPAAEFVYTEPHPYRAIGAPYDPGVTPFSLRAGVLQALRTAQQQLQKEQPGGWRIKVFDAYRPVTVQQFMVDYTFTELAAREGLEPGTLAPEQRRVLLERVYQFWAPPSLDPADAPPHSTGAAIDVTLVDTGGRDVDFGSPVDEVSVRSYPDRFARATTAPERAFHQHRQLLRRCMLVAGFAAHPREWWHFSLGDRLWAWQQHQLDPNVKAIARYGRADLLDCKVRAQAECGPDARERSGTN